jgi:hypothetical protein
LDDDILRADAPRAGREAERDLGPRHHDGGALGRALGIPAHHDGGRRGAAAGSAVSARSAAGERWPARDRRVAASVVVGGAHPARRWA